jgi:hypothetical protein
VVAAVALLGPAPAAAAAAAAAAAEAAEREEAGRPDEGPAAVAAALL